VYKIGKSLFIDPTREEEEAYEARLTVASDDKGILSAMQKGGEAPLTTEEIAAMIDLALEKAKFLRKTLNNFLKK
jgi:exosome complex RNA-binding protein Rrp42 (RNase PH superfamily)